jgi:hypothetical protein
MTARLSVLAANAAADAVTSLLDDGYLRIYDGIQPASTDVPVTSQVLLAELRFADPAFGPAIDGIATAHPIASDPAAAASGTAAWFRALRSDGTTVIHDGSIAASGGQMTSSDPWIAAGSSVEVEDFTYQEPRS